MDCVRTAQDRGQRGGSCEHGRLIKPGILRYGKFLDSLDDQQFPKNDFPPLRWFFSYSLCFCTHLGENVINRKQGWAKTKIYYHIKHSTDSIFSYAVTILVPTRVQRACTCNSPRTQSGVQSYAWHPAKDWSAKSSGASLQKHSMCSHDPLFGLETSSNLIVVSFTALSHIWTGLDS
jgi:hypothetical protein